MKTSKGNPPMSQFKTEWDLTPFFASDDDPLMEKERQRINEESYKFINKWKDRTDYLTDPKVLKEALDEYEQWNRNGGVEFNELYYFYLRTKLNQSDPALKAKFTKAEDLSKKIGSDVNFFRLNLAKISVENQTKLLNSPLLAEYKHFLERIFASSAHMLSEAEEKIMLMKSSTALYNWIRMLDEFLSHEERLVVDEDGKKKKLPFESIIKIATYAKEKKIRDGAVKGLNSIIEANLAVGENEINAVLADKKVDDELRKFSRPDASRHLDDDIDASIVDVLVATVTSRFEIARKYYALKAALLGVPKLAYNERNLEYGSVEKNYSFDEAAQLVTKVFSELDSEFSDILERFLREGNIDVFPKKGKSGGAFCIDLHKSQPTYVLLNHAGTLNDVRTLAHEMGHAINAEIMRTKQNELNFGNTMAAAEVASNFMEDFVTQEIMKSADDELRLSLMMTSLNDDVSSIFRQIAFYSFEKDLHALYREKGYLSKVEIGNLFQTHMISYMGDAVSQDKGTENYWLYVNHFRQYFYVYSYASGQMIAKSLQGLVKKDPQFISQVKVFLGAGTSDSPKAIFAKMGIDITDANFWNQGLDEVEALLKETEALAKKLGKIPSK